MLFDSFKKLSNNISRVYRLEWPISLTAHWSNNRENSCKKWSATRFRRILSQHVHHFKSAELWKINLWWKIYIGWSVQFKQKALFPIFYYLVTVYVTTWIGEHTQMHKSLLACSCPCLLRLSNDHWLTCSSGQWKHIRITHKVAVVWPFHLVDSSLNDFHYCARIADAYPSASICFFGMIFNKRLHDPSRLSLYLSPFILSRPN